MRAAALILAVLLTAVPVTDTGTGTAGEYDTSSVTESVRATASVAPTAETEGAAQRDDVGIVPYGEASYRQVTKTPAANVSDDHEREADADQQVSFDEKGYLSFCTWREIEMLACLVDREIGAGTRIEKEAVVWCVLNRFDRGSAAGFKDTISGVLLQVNQFYSSYVVGSIESQNVVVDVLTLWMMERQSGYPVDGRCLPREFCWYCSDHNHRHNLFHDRYIPGIGQCGNEWDWSWTGGY